MPVTLFATTPETLYEEDSSQSLSGATSVAVLHRFKILTAIDFNDYIARSNGSFGYTLYGGTTGQINGGFRTNGQNSAVTGIATGLTAGDEVSTWAVSTIGVDVKHYANGVLVNTTADPTSTAYFGNWQAQFEGPGVVGRSVELIEKAVWFSGPPSSSDILAYPATPLASFGVQPDRQWTPVGGNGVFAPTLTADLGAVDMSQIAGPVTGGLEPVYSGAADSLSIDYVERSIQRNSESGVTRNFTGTYTGTIVEPLEIRATRSGAPISGLDWQAATYNIGGGVFDIDFPLIPNNDDIILQVRDSTGVPIVASTGLINVGDIELIYGQSNPQQFGSSPTISVTPATGCWVYTLSTETWAQGSSVNQHYANELSALRGVPVSVVNVAIGSTAMALLVPGSSHWDNNVAPILNAVGDFSGLTFGHGESDANAGTAPATYKAGLDSILSGCLAINGRTTANFDTMLWSLGVNEGSGDVVNWPQMRITQQEWCDETAGAYLGAHAIDAVMADSLHYTTDWKVELTNRLVKSKSFLAGSSAVNALGPRAASFTIDGSISSVKFSTNGATSLTKGVGDATGWQVFTDGTYTTELTVTAAEIVGNTVEITTSVAPTEDARIRYLWAADPDKTNIVYGAGYDIDNIGASMVDVGFQPEISPENSIIGISISQPLIEAGIVIEPFDVSVSISISSPVISEITSINPDNVIIGIAISSTTIGETSFTFTNKLVIVRG